MAAELPAPLPGEQSAGDCAVCWSAPVACVLTACGHAVLCSECLDRIVAAAPPAQPKCPVCSTPIPPRAWKPLAARKASEPRSFRREFIDPLRVAEAAALRAGRSAFPTGVAAFLDHVRLREYATGRENLLLRVAAHTDGALDATATLLDRGAAVSSRDARGRTPLHVAAAANAADTVLLLLQRGASANAVDSDGRTPLHCAAAASAAAAAHWLVGAGAPLETRDSGGATPLLLAAASTKDDDECIRVLLQSGANIDAQDPRGWTALHRAMSVNASSCVETLIWRGARKTVRARDGKRPADCTKSLQTRLMLATTPRGPSEVVAHRPQTLRLRWSLAAVACVVVGALVRKWFVDRHSKRLLLLEAERKRYMLAVMVEMKLMKAMLRSRIELLARGIHIPERDFVAQQREYAAVIQRLRRAQADASRRAAVFPE
jgi:hypothetical protein